MTGDPRWADLEVDDLRLAVEGATFELAPRGHLLVDHPVAQPLQGAGQDVLVHLGAAHRLPVHVLSVHLGVRRDSGLCSRARPGRAWGSLLRSPGRSQALVAGAEGHAVRGARARSGATSAGVWGRWQGGLCPRFKIRPEKTRPGSSTGSSLFPSGSRKVPPWDRPGLSFVKLLSRPSGALGQVSRR